MITTLQLVTQNTTVSNRQRLTLLNSLPSAGHVIATASASAASASVFASASEAARDAALLSRGVFATTAKALSKGVVSTTGLVGGSGGTNGTFALAFSGGAGSGAAGVFTVAGGAVTSITITASGDSYTSAPAISFAASSGLTGASATAVIADNVSAGEWFSVPVSGTNDALILYENVSGTATERVRYPSSAITSQTVNKAKVYPQRSMTRAGTTSAASSTLNNLLLDVKVIGPAAAINGKYFKIAYWQNEASLGGDNDHGLVIQEFDAATYAATGTPTDIHHYNDPAPTIDRAGGVQTFVLTPKQRSHLRFIVTIDAAALPAAGTAINAYNNSANPAWSWIIDPACYIPVDEAGATSLSDSIVINRGKSFPLKSMSRLGTTSAASSTLNNLLLDVQVIGPASSIEGKYFRLSWWQNETSFGGDSDFGMIIEEHTAATYSTTDTRVIIHDHNNAPATIVRGGGIQTVVITPAQRPSLRIAVTVDAAYLPAAGTTIDANSDNTRPAWSWVIDPACHVPVHMPQATEVKAGVYYTLASGLLTVAWQSDSLLYRLRFGPNGKNSLPNIVGLDRAPAGDPALATWTQINTSTTDYLPPLVFSADASGDGGSAIYTGGNHGSDGSAGGSNTARNVMFELLADNKPLPASASGYAESITAVIVNELMAYNTITLTRYCLRQTFHVTIRAGSMEVLTEHKALEAITVTTDNGPQAVTTGYQGTQLIYGGSNTARVTFSADLTSGAKSSYPNAWALVLMDGTNGQQVSWMDRSYGIGNGAQVGAANPYIRGGTGSNTKYYHAAIAGVPLAMAAGASYKWRGGYCWQAPGLQPAGFDSFFVHHRGGKAVPAYGFSDASFSIIE